MNALMQIPQSASAMLRTSRLLGVRSSLIFRKEIIVKPFRQKPSRAEIQNCLAWFNRKWKISTMILLFSLLREQLLLWKLMHREYLCSGHSLHSSYKDFQERSHRWQLKPLSASGIWPVMWSRNGLILFVILPFVLIEKPDFQALPRDTWVRVREIQRRQFQRGWQPARASGAYISRPVFGREMGCV